jgi:hypothetical protein
MASYSKSVQSYRDIHLAFEAAGNSSGITLTFESSAKAVTWNGRANAYRVLIRRQNQEAGREFASEFDHLMVRRKAGELTVRIEPRGFEFTAVNDDGEAIDFSRRTLDGAVRSPHEKTQDAESIDSFLAGYEVERKK